MSASNSLSILRSLYAKAASNNAVAPKGGGTYAKRAKSLRYLPQVLRTPLSGLGDATPFREFRGWSDGRALVSRILRRKVSAA